MKMKQVLLEVIGTTREEVVTAARNGADRIELITAITEGGLTPSLGLVQEAVEAVDIPVNVMIRPHSRSFNMMRMICERLWLMCGSSVPPERTRSYSAP